MACKNIIIDKVSADFKAVIPSGFDGMSDKIKSLTINNTLKGAAPDINGMVGNAVSNFKGMATGKIPSLKFPDLDPASFFEDIQGELEDTLSQFKGLRSMITSEKDNLLSQMSEQFECINSDIEATVEVAKSQGDMFSTIKSNVGDITNNQLRDFNSIPSFQTDIVNTITADTIASTQAALEAGVSDTSKAASQVDKFSIIDSL